MFTYEVGYDSYEEAPIITLFNEKEYTQEQFDELVADCTVRVYNAPRKEEDYFSPRFESLMGKVIDLLVDEFGFKHTEVKARFQPFGWAKVDNDEDWKQATEHDKQMNLIRKKIKYGKK